MAKQTKKATAVAPVKVKKATSVRVRSLQDARPFLSVYRDIEPLNELTETQLIAEGYRNPLAVRPDFSKTKEEKKELHAMKVKVGYHTPWAPPTPYENIAQRITVQLKQKLDRAGKVVNRNEPDFQNIKSAVLKPSEIYMYLLSLQSKAVDVVKYTYKGKVFTYGKN